MLARLVASLFIVFASIVPAAAAATAPAFETKAKQAYLIDAETGTVLFAKNEEAAVPPASLAKLMTMEVVFDALKKGEIHLDTSFPVSEHAWRTGGAPSGTSTMFAALKSQVPVADLIRGVAVLFANDACIILAEGMAGSEDAFAARMTKRAGELGLKASSFHNATGLPNPDNTMTMRDLVTLARHVQTTYPDIYPLYSEVDFEWNKIRQRNRNPLVSANIGVDGFVTGFAEGYGYSMVASMQRDGKRVFLAIGGLDTDKDRIEETRKMLEWSMSAFEKRRLFEAGEPVGEAAVYGGTVGHVSLVTAEPVDVLVPVNNPDRLVARVVYRWPLPMPIKAGQPAGTLKVWNGDRLLREIPVTTAAAVETGSLSSRALDALQEMLFFWL
ncbi:MULTISPECIES: D-alanyl-D-alanine carboxypeptidase family protein [unclassified Rhizobium]|uniref:D-alanyl-D-alanine carboxypeptidase family protein n=1 Tax=unclassified Rhizobium TaxID=2613769 RepID=UPI0006FF3B78|nr:MULTISPECIES: D-alanyl-D-alanine carboxypeptidase family protein [unclassified Rhizobium]KQV34332.1 D-alanyl-D-alanine carboxypeptidase [Rhizobium sp. Root1212]KRD23710.1 D-alanyl-D-alanine carboxypeptidase [Rhizobium sp. Root268]